MSENLERDARIERAQDKNEHLARVVALNDRLDGLANDLATNWDDVSELIEYYAQEWRDDADALGGTPGGDLEVFAPDRLPAELRRYYAALQSVAETATRIVTEFEQSGMLHE